MSCTHNAQVARLPPDTRVTLVYIYLAYTLYLQNETIYWHTFQNGSSYVNAFFLKSCLSYGVFSRQQNSNSDRHKVLWIFYGVMTVAACTCAQISRTSPLQNFYFIKIVCQSTQQKKNMIQRFNPQCSFIAVPLLFLFSENVFPPTAKQKSGMERAVPLVTNWVFFNLIPANKQK